MKFSVLCRHASTILVAGAIAGTSLFGVTQANAAKLLWDVEANFTTSPYDDGSTLSGSFKYDTVTNSFSDASLTLSNSSQFGASTLFDEISSVFGPSGSLLAVAASGSGVDLTGDGMLTLFALDFTTIGPPFSGTQDAQLNRCTDANCGTLDIFGQEFNTTTVLMRSSVLTPVSPLPSAVPLPAALPLFGTGLAILGLAGWRRKRSVSVS